MTGRTRKQARFTLIEVMIVVAIVVIFCLIAFNVLSRWSKRIALTNLQRYVREMEWNVVGASCDTDSDRDGYIFCTAPVREESKGSIVEKKLLCESGAKSGRTKGCKPLPDTR